MFGIGMPEMILILAVALIVIGPKKLPELAKSLGKAMGEFKKATRELKDSISLDDEIDDAKKTFKDITYDLDKIGTSGEETKVVDEPVLTQHNTSGSESKAEEDLASKTKDPGIIKDD